MVLELSMRWTTTHFLSDAYTGQFDRAPSRQTRHLARTCNTQQRCCVATRGIHRTYDAGVIVVATRRQDPWSRACVSAIMHIGPRYCLDLCDGTPQLTGGQAVEVKHASRGAVLLTTGVVPGNAVQK
jgi:hypothetical protein